MKWVYLNQPYKREGTRRIIIELPGVKDPDEAIKRTGKTAVLNLKTTKVKLLWPDDLRC